MCDVPKIFDEFVFKMCEEVILRDSKYQDINNKILLLEGELKLTLNESQKKLYTEISNLICELEAHEQLLLYKSGFNKK